MAWLHKTRLGWGVILLFLGISTGGLGVYQFIKHDRSARQEPDVRNPRPTSSVQNEKAGEAEYKRGVAYLQGEGVPKNEEEAVKWLAKGAEQGDADAQFSIGDCYERGVGVVKDEEEAVIWYAKAAEQGFAEAQYNLGVCYENGEGIPVDLKEAFKWYTRAAELGLALAKERLRRR
jgi:TPR repeat protein